MAVTMAPSTETMQAIVARINSGEAYCLDVVATYSEQIVDVMEEITELRVDVVDDEETQLQDTLDIENRTSHAMAVWVRKKVCSLSNDEIDPLKLLIRQLFQRLNNYDSADGRVRVWEIDQDSKQCPNKRILNEQRLFVSPIYLRVEVGAS